MSNIKANAINPNVKIVAVHMGALDHCFSTRADLKQMVSGLSSDMQKRIFIPDDGEALML